MAKTTAPLFGFSASGTIAKTLTYSRWKGIQYTRERVIPANPKTTAQVLVRNVFSNLDFDWLYAPAAITDPYTLAAAGRPLTNRNLWIKANAKAGIDDTESSNQLASPGIGGAPPITNLDQTTSGSDTHVTFDLPATPTGWTLVGVTAVQHITEHYPQPTADPGYLTATSATSPITITGRTPLGTTVSVYTHYTRTDGSTTYSIAVNHSTNA